MFKNSVLVGSALCAFVTFADQAAFAGSRIVLQTDQTQMIALTQDPGTVVVGNPSIADVSVDGKRVFMHGRGYGNTNIAILDAQGNQLANFDVSVTHDANNEVALFYATSRPIEHVVRYSFACEPLCQREMIPGDEAVFFGEITGANARKYSMATGSTSAPVAASANGSGGAPAQ